MRKLDSVLVQSIRAAACMFLLASLAHAASGQVIAQLTGSSGDFERTPTTTIHFELSDDPAELDTNTPIEIALARWIQPLPVLRPSLTASDRIPMPSGNALRDLPASLLTSARDLRGFTAIWDAQQGAFGRAATDAVSLIDKTPGTEIGVQHRNPIINDPRVRGARNGQTINSGSYWLPARPDLDTALSKIDAQLVDSVTIIRGPYSVRYGAGFNVIHVDLAAAERFAAGAESHGSSTLSYKTNGEQWYGRQRFWGGNETVGWRGGYSHATAGDFHAGGGGLELPSSYNSRTADLSFGWDISPDERLSITYLRVDQTNVELPAQFFDFNFLGTDAVEAQCQSAGKTSQ